MDVRYSLNGKYFKGFGIYISAGFKTLVSGLKLQEQKGYIWPEYHGAQFDKDAVPRFLPREISLTGFVEGADWKVMTDNFNAVFGELKKKNTQRLLCEVGNDVVAADVMLAGEYPELSFEVKDGRNLALFTLKLIEPNPVKKVLYLNGSNFTLSFNTSKWVDVNIDGVNTTVKGPVNMTKTIPDRNIQGVTGSTATLKTKHYIVVAGNIGEITGFTTNAAVKWEEL